MFYLLLIFNKTIMEMWTDKSYRIPLKNMGFHLASKLISTSDWVLGDEAVICYSLELKGALVQHHPQLFPKKVGIFIQLAMLAWVMTACRVLRSRLIYFWRNIIIHGIFYFSKLTSINTQYSSLWDTLKMILLTKYLIKWEHIGTFSWKFRYWFNLESSIE